MGDNRLVLNIDMRQNNPEDENIMRISDITKLLTLVLVCLGSAFSQQPSTTTTADELCFGFY